MLIRWFYPSELQHGQGLQEAAINLFRGTSFSAFKYPHGLIKVPLKKENVTDFCMSIVTNEYKFHFQQQQLYKYAY